MAELVLLARAKVNLTLDVGPLRPDGYHEVMTVLQELDLADRLVFARAPRGVLEVTCRAPGVPEGPGNLAYQALAHLLPLLPGGVRLEIEKEIPAAAGLGGGSSDAACALVGATLLYGLRLGKEELVGYASRVGADVPFFIFGGTALARGRGEVVSPLPPLPPLWFVLANPGFGVSTREAYARFRGRKGSPRTPLLVEALVHRDLTGVLGSLGNDLEEVVTAMHPEVGRLKRRLEELGAVKALMSGSGPTVYGVFLEEEAARAAAAELERTLPWARLCRPSRREEEEQEGGIAPWKSPR